MWFINPDALASRIAAHERLPLMPEANLEAVRRIERWLYASVDAHQTVGVETVLATDKYRALVERARANGYRIRLIYVFLNDADLNVSRVRDRVAKGGHDVPEASIRNRRVRSFGQLSWFFEAADEADVLDNSGAEPRLVVAKDEEAITIFGRLIPELTAALVPVVPGLAELLAERQANPRRRRRGRRRRGGRRRRRPAPAASGAPASKPTATPAQRQHR